MEHIEIDRLEESQGCTIGILRLNGLVFCPTLELPWKNNEVRVSRIPAGQYTLKHYSSKKYPNALEVQDVYKRTKILIHQGNTVNDILGCILVGRETGYLEGRRAVLASTITLKKLMSSLKGSKDIRLTIRDRF